MTADARIGITSTVPSEIIFAAGLVPVDVNNLFIAAPDPAALVRRAKMDGFPDTTCSWICGLYGAIMEQGIRRVVGVCGGDCAETQALMEVLAHRGVEVIPFSYPYERDREALRGELESFAARLGASMDEAERVKTRLDAVRARVHRLDELLWKEDRAFGEEVRLVELQASDFNGDPDAYAAMVEKKLAEIGAREPMPPGVRLGMLGVPPIVKDLYAQLERDGTRVVFSEVERQFTLPAPGSIEESYHRYTYPYGINARLEDIGPQVKARGIDGLVHYVQAFCFRGIEDIVLRAKLPVPVLTLQGDLPTRMTETMKIRIEAFTDMLVRARGRS
jgi:benzoyl-CoA reductase/2-hydroxyglutaryl-CoA dehydratase subunit BcrC/BadD/HgdB